MKIAYLKEHVHQIYFISITFVILAMVVVLHKGLNYAVPLITATYLATENNKNTNLLIFSVVLIIIYLLRMGFVIMAIQLFTFVLSFLILSLILNIIVLTLESQKE